MPHHCTTRANITGEQARISARMHRRIVEKLALATGVTPAEFERRHGKMSIVAGQDVALTPRQQAIRDHKNRPRRGVTPVPDEVIGSNDIPFAMLTLALSEMGDVERSFVMHLIEQIDGSGSDVDGQRRIDITQRLGTELPINDMLARLGTARGSANGYANDLFTFANLDALVDDILDPLPADVAIATEPAGTFSQDGTRDINTPEFKAFFEGSQVVDEAGQPLTVYHGTNEVTFEGGATTLRDPTTIGELGDIGAKYGISQDIAFMLEQWVEIGHEPNGVPVSKQDATRARELTNAARSRVSTRGKDVLGFDTFNQPEGPELGVHFGTEHQAGNFGVPFGFYLRIENPLDLPDLGVWHPSDVAAAAQSAGVEFAEGEVNAALDGLEGKEANAAIRELLKSKGFDDVRYENKSEGAGRSYVIFDPEQAKSADNRGTFSRETANIFNQNVLESVDGSQEPDGSAGIDSARSEGVTLPGFPREDGTSRADGKHRLDNDRVDGDFKIRTAIVTDRDRDIGTSRVLTAEDAAQAMAYLGRSAVEHFDALVVDKDGQLRDTVVVEVPEVGLDATRGARRRNRREVHGQWRRAGGRGCGEVDRRAANGVVEANGELTRREAERRQTERIHRVRNAHAHRGHIDGQFVVDVLLRQRRRNRATVIDGVGFDAVERHAVVCWPQGNWRRQQERDAATSVYRGGGSDLRPRSGVQFIADMGATGCGDVDGKLAIGAMAHRGLVGVEEMREIGRADCGWTHSSRGRVAGVFGRGRARTAR